MRGRGGQASPGKQPGATVRRGRGYAAASAAVGLALVLAIARADYLVGETAGKACGGLRDAVRWSLMVGACHLSDMDRFDVVNGGLVVLVALAALNPTLLALRITLLIPVLMYLSDAGRMRATRVATGRIYPGIELWWLPIFWLSTLTLLAAAVVAAFEWGKRRRDSRRCGSVAGAQRRLTAVARTPQTAPDDPPPAAHPRP